MKTSVSFSTFLVATLLGLQAFGGAIVTYHGRIVKPDGSALEGSGVTFKVQVRSPGAPSCLLYEETRNVNMSSSNGIFVIPIGDGNGVRTGADPGITIENVFSNNAALNFTGLGCNSGSTYSPANLDSRRLVVTFDDGSGAGPQLLNPMDINYVPLALHTLQAQTALSVGATPAANVMTVSGPASALTPSNFTELLALVNGTSTTYAKTSSSVGGDLSGTIASANVVKLQGRAVSSSAPSTNDVLTWNGSAWAPAAGGGGGAVSSVAGRTGAVVLAHTDISGLGDSATKNVGTTAGTVAAGDDARFGTASVFTGSFTGDVTGTQSATVVSAVGGSTATNVHNAELLANSATSANTASTIVRRDANGDFTSRDASLRSVILRDSGSKNITMVAPATLTNSYTLTWPLDKGSLNQVLTTDASGNLSWSTPAGTGVSSVTSGGAPIVIGGSGSAPTVSVNAATDSTSGVVTLATDGGTTASTVVQATDARLSNARAPSGSAGGDLGSTYPNPTVNGLKGAAITYTSLTTGDFLKYNGTAWVNTSLSSANLSNNSDLLKASQMPANCAAGSSLTFSSPTGTWVCTTIPSATTSVAGIVTLSADNATVASTVVQATDSRLTNARAPSGSAGGDLSSTYPNPTVSKINGVGLSYTSLTSGDYLKYNGTNWVNATLPAGASYWTAATGGINYAGGNVGIGTTTPVTTLNAVSTGGSDRGITADQNSSDTLAARLQFRKSRGTPGSPSAVSASDVIGNVSYNAYDGSAYAAAASVSAAAEQSWTGSVHDAYLSFFTTSATTLAERMRISANGNVGIGTTSPTQSLDIATGGFVVRGARSVPTSGNGLVLDFGGLGGANTGSVQGWDYSGVGTARNIVLQPAGGNVGIGTTGPGSALDVSSSATGSAISATFRSTPGVGTASNFNSIVLDNRTGAGNFKNQISFRSAGAEKWAIGNDYAGTGGQDFYIYDNVAGLPRMTVSSSGNVGIGTTTPASPLQVNGSIQFGNDAGTCDATKTGALRNNSGTLQFCNGSAWATVGAGGTQWTTTGSDIYYSGGKVGIGTSTPSVKLDISGASATNTFLMQITNTTADGEFLKGVGYLGNESLSLRQESDGSGQIAVYDTSGTRVVRITGNPASTTFFNGANVGIGTASPAYTLDVNGSARATGSVAAWSDIRAKRNIAEISNALEKINQVRGVTFDWRHDEFPDQKFKEGRDMGVIAQEIEKVFPEAVQTAPDGFKSVAYPELVAPLIEGMKELFAKFLGIDQRVEALEAQNKKLMQELELQAKDLAEIKKKIGAQ